MVYTFRVVDVKEYIESGIIESVVLGFATAKEVAEVQHYAELYPEIKAEWIAISRSFEREASLHAVPPAPEMKDRILSAIGKTPQDQPSQSETKVIPLSQGNTSSNPWKWAAAASIVLLLGVGTLWVLNFNEVSRLRNELQTAQATLKSNEQEITILTVEQQKSSELKKVLAQLDTKNITMKGMPMEPTANVHIMWNEESKMAVMKSVAINEIPTEMQLQLWAIADGKPVSLGVFDVAELEEMTDPFEVSANNISAFAITIEKRGGSQAPTMEKMVVMGAVAS